MVFVNSDLLPLSYSGSSSVAAISTLVQVLFGLHLFTLVGRHILLWFRLACISYSGLSASLALACLLLLLWVACISSSGLPAAIALVCLFLLLWVACISSSGLPASIALGDMHL